MPSRILEDWALFLPPTCLFFCSFHDCLRPLENGDSEGLGCCQRNLQGNVSHCSQHCRAGHHSWSAAAQVSGKEGYPQMAILEGEMVIDHQILGGSLFWDRLHMSRFWVFVLWGESVIRRWSEMQIYPQYGSIHPNVTAVARYGSSLEQWTIPRCVSCLMNSRTIPKCRSTITWAPYKVETHTQLSW